jgi:chaperonin cofactor prefoldin
MDSDRDLGELTQEITLEVTQELRLHGLEADAAEIEELAHEIEEIEHPPGVLKRMGSAVKNEAARQWQCALDELRESKEAWRLIRDRVRGGRRLSPEEADAVRSQVVDAVKSIPAGLLTAASYLIPVPGAMVITPMLLERVGLMPSRWLETSALAKLERRARDLHEKGQHHSAERLEELHDAIEDRLAERSKAASDSTLRTYWDTDGDGAIDDVELAAYEAELDRLAALVPRVGARRRWYLQVGGHVDGPIRWGETGNADPDLPVFVCLDGKSGWVELEALRRRAGFGDAEPA